MVKITLKEKEMQHEIDGLKIDLILIYSNCLKIAISNDYKKIIEYLNPNPEEIIQIKEEIKNDEKDKILKIDEYHVPNK